MNFDCCQSAYKSSWILYYISSPVSAVRPNYIASHWPHHASVNPVSRRFQASRPNGWESLQHFGILREKVHTDGRNSPPHLRQYQLRCALASLDAVSSQLTNSLTKLRTVACLPNVYQQVPKLRHLTVDVLYLLQFKYRIEVSILTFPSNVFAWKIVI